MTFSFLTQWSTICPASTSDLSPGDTQVEDGSYFCVVATLVAFVEDLVFTPACCCLSPVMTLSKTLDCDAFSVVL